MLKKAFLLFILSTQFMFNTCSATQAPGRTQKKTLKDKLAKTKDSFKKAIEKAKGYKTSFNIGLGLGQQSDLYVNGNQNFPLIPVLGFKYKNFYGYGVTLGYTFFWGWPSLTLAATPEFLSLTPEPGTVTQGLTRRKSSINAGLKAIFPTKFVITTIDIYHDTLGRYDGLKMNIDFNKPIKLSKKTQLIVGVGIDWLSKNYTNYYFGVSAQEASRTTFSAFAPKDSYSPKARLVFIYNLTKKLSLVLLEEFTSLPKEISDSPLVKNDYINRFYGTITYSF